MNNIKNKITIGITMVSLLFGVGSCETLELELLDDPNALNSSNASPDFFVSQIQLSLKDFFFEVTEPGQELTRMVHMFGPLYQNAYAPSDFDTAWTIAYAEIMADVRSLRPVAEEQELYTHIAIGEIAEAYVITTLVDFMGDIPYSESNDGVTFNPVADSGASVYANMLTLLDAAIANLNRSETRLPAEDFFYGGDEDKWIALANSLKIKIHLQQRLVEPAQSAAGINAIVASGDYITDSDGDFTFRFGTTDTNPDSRHPIFARNFTESVGVTDYMSNHFMNLLLNEKASPDPRTRYYYYRQRATNAQNTVEQDCVGTLPPAWYGFTIPYCNLDGNPGYWGRDHGYELGIPPDTGIRATWGLYPVGGNFDADNFEPIPDRNIGTVGAGFEPIMLSSFVDFMLAEAALELGTSGNARAYLESGIRASMDKVTNFRTDLVDETFAATAAEIDAYVDEVLASFDAASADDQLNIIIEEYFIALYGNGVEAYNSYRRTGKPDDLQPLLREDTDRFLRSFLYPDVYVNQNINASQKPDVFQKVFWDTNPDNGFIN
ncbi:SusD/RagB family nutrient-binding outer membrane lipoprotein [Muriicola sp. Z0-33]|uniref:SusD/RagB family nutrient-binding outer membrane lipoprotein n=1 Tax=Muriicola sp. Z0-33 TaxID=2816957 RepID=UPI002237FBDB|nr:SusD/RagB family nutrient-binding outer membrane lipoprotein [Muriicola sp. Z0-33]MCW5516780.1 SusD/RagB family nutrient-binding outer membrane lipoprotein [Muriicola sp. Z0-33]